MCQPGRPAPKAIEALGELADAILSGGDDPSAPAALIELCRLVGVDPTRPLD